MVYERKVNDEVTVNLVQSLNSLFHAPFIGVECARKREFRDWTTVNQIHEFAIKDDKSLVLTQISFTAVVYGMTCRKRLSLPSCVLDFFSVFIFPRMCLDGADPRNHLVHQGDAPVGHRCCTQAQCSTSIGQPGKIWGKKTQEKDSHKSLPANQIHE